MDVVLFVPMVLWKRRIPFILLLVTTLLASLPVLAYLQYRWLGQVSEAERERMQGNLRRSVQQFREDFDRDLARAYLQFQHLQPKSREEIPSRYFALLEDSKTKTPGGKLIKELYWVDSSRARQLELYRLEGNQGTKVEWPSEFQSWRDHITSQQEPSKASLHSFQFLLGGGARREAAVKQTEILVSRPAPHAEGKAGSPVVRVVGKTDNAIFTGSQRVIEESPALVIPISILSRGPARGQTVQRSDFIIATLDLDYLRNDRFPALVKKYFQSGDGLDYQVAVLSRTQPRKVIYQSSAQISTDIASTSDASSGLLALRPDDLASVLDTYLRSVQGVRDQLVTSDRVTMKVMSSGGFDKLPPSANAVVAEMDGYWQIFLKHKAGSLEAAVGSVRRRSVALSLGVLAFLGASIVLLLISTRRAQRLAEQQIDFVAGVSHELRTPLAVIRSAAENLADGYVENPDQIRKYGAVIRDEGRRLTDMVEQVLEVAGVQSGRREYQLRPVDPRDIAEQAIAGCSMLISETGFEIDLHMDSRLPMVNGDSAALVRALQNLITNAIKYSADKKLLRIRMARVKSESRDEVRIEVEDFGVGISAADLPHIFEPFFRARDVVNAQIHGSGLGLSLVKHIIDAHGGRIVVQSYPGKGTTFHVFLPVAGPAINEMSVIEGYEQTHPAH